MGWPAELQEAVDCIDVRDSCVRSRSLMVLQAAVAPLGPCAQSTCVSPRASSWPALLGPRDPQRAVGMPVSLLCAQHIRIGLCPWTFSSPVATAEFSKFAGILSAALSLLGFEIAQLEFHHFH